MTRPPMPGRYWYAISAALLLGGFVGAGLFLFSRIGGIEIGLMRAVVPGATMLALDEPGSYTIFHEPRSVIDGKLYASDTIAGLRVTVTAETGGAAVPLTRPTADERYSINGREGVAVWEFSIPAPGRYQLSGNYDDNRSGPPVGLAIGHSFLSTLLRTIATTLVIVFANGGAAIAIFLIVFFKRRRARRAAAAAA